MLVQSGQSIVKPFPTRNASGASTNADSTPAGILYVNGVANGAAITIANLSTGLYTASFTVPAGLADFAQLVVIVSATIGGTASKGEVWAATKLDAPTAVQIASELASRHGSGSWEGKRENLSRGTGNPAAGFAVRSGHSEVVDVFFQLDGFKQKIRVMNAIPREVDTATATQAGISLMGNETVWNLPVRDLMGLTLRTGDKLVKKDRTRHQVIGFGTSINGNVGVFGEEVRPVTRQEV